jgi:hypothetical protein
MVQITDHKVVGMRDRRLLKLPSRVLGHFVPDVCQEQDEHGSEKKQSYDMDVQPHLAASYLLCDVLEGTLGQHNHVWRGELAA